MEGTLAAVDLICILSFWGGYLSSYLDVFALAASLPYDTDCYAEEDSVQKS